MESYGQKNVGKHITNSLQYFHTQMNIMLYEHYGRLHHFKKVFELFKIG